MNTYQGIKLYNHLILRCFLLYGWRWGDAVSSFELVGFVLGDE